MYLLPNGVCSFTNEYQRIFFLLENDGLEKNMEFHLTGLYKVEMFHIT